MKPKNVGTNFMGSIFGNSECETILANIILMQKKINPEAWTPFTWEEYAEFRTATMRNKDHGVSTIEKDILDAFVEGGRIAYSSARISKDWLSFSEDGKYAFTDKMINMLEKEYFNYEVFNRFRYVSESAFNRYDIPIGETITAIQLTDNNREKCLEWAGGDADVIDPHKYNFLAKRESGVLFVMRSDYFMNEVKSGCYQLVD